MPVARNSQAVTSLERLLTQPYPEIPGEVLSYGPSYRLVDPTGWLWSAEEAVPAYGDPAAYDLAALTTVQREDLDQPPSVMVDDAGTGYGGAQKSEYCRWSIDVTMKGGITSGVVYPLTICEVARRFRFRNLGGASAGAIAASLAAAAELGRMRGVSHAVDSRTAEEVRQGRLRAGFAGLADIVTWLTQLEPPAGGGPVADEFRLSQLFKPTRAGLPLFQLAVAVMRRKYLSAPALVLKSLPGWGRVVTIGAFLLAPLLLSLAVTWSSTSWPVVGRPSDWPVGVPYLVSALLLWLLLLALAPILVAVTARPPRPDPVMASFRPPIPPPPAPQVSKAHVGRLIAVGLLMFVAFVVATTVALGWRGYAAVAAALLAEVTIIGLGFVIGVSALLKGAKAQRYGLVGGAASNDPERAAPVADPGYSAMVIPPVTVGANLSDWLSTALGDLSGLGATEVVRFGDLWLGQEYRDGASKARLQEVVDQPRARRINLELMTTEVVRRAPYRFPLTADAEQLYFDPADLDGIVPPHVIEAMKGHAAPMVGVETPFAPTPLTLYPLPAPYDLPVVFATRASLSFPGLFQAIRLYVVSRGSVPVRTEFGQTIDLAAASDVAIGGPSSEAAVGITYPADPAPYAQELWFTDGGATSNFPIHMFDTPLPLWPTVGIDLGEYPLGADHQDVYLATDDGSRRDLAHPMKQSMVGFIGAIVGTALNWRDSAQLLMPAFKGRVAVVRQRSYEGGSNLFMRREDVASLALRGAVAGMRLRRRFADDQQWRRHQWLRVRVAADNFGGLARSIRTALRDPWYHRLIANTDARRVQPGSAALAEIEQGLVGHADPVLPDQWYVPASEQFWPDLASLVESLGDIADGTPELLTEGAPRPLAELRQVPRL